MKSCFRFYTSYETRLDAGVKAKTIRVVQYGLGHIGREVVHLLLRRPQFHLVGVIDNDPRKAGRALRRVRAPVQRPVHFAV